MNPQTKPKRCRGASKNNGVANSLGGAAPTRGTKDACIPLRAQHDGREGERKVHTAASSFLSWSLKNSGRHSKAKKHDRTKRDALRKTRAR